MLDKLLDMSMGSIEIDIGWIGELEFCVNGVGDACVIVTVVPGMDIIHALRIVAVPGNMAMYGDII